MAGETFQVLLPPCFKPSLSSAATPPASYHLPPEYLPQNPILAVSTWASSLAPLDHHLAALSCRGRNSRLIPVDRLPGVPSGADNGAFIFPAFCTVRALIWSLSSLLGCWLPLNLLKFSSHWRNQLFLKCHGNYHMFSKVNREMMG